MSLSLAPDISMTGWLLVSYIGLWIGYAALAVLSLVALANLGTVRRSFVALSHELKPTISNLKVGQSLPIARLQTLAGDGLSTSEFRGQSRAFAIVSPTCGPCRTYMQTLASDPGDGSSVGLSVRPVLVSLGDVDGTKVAVGEAHLPDDVIVLVDVWQDVREKWGISGTPTTVLVDEQLRLTSQSAGIGCPAEPSIPMVEPAAAASRASGLAPDPASVSRT